MRYRIFLGVAILVSAVFAVAITPNSASQAAAINQTEKIRKLLQERIEVLTKRVEAFERRYENGLCSIESVVDARDDLFAAKLDLAVSREERIDLLTSRMGNLKQGEQHILELYMVGGRKGSETDTLLATSRRLMAEIELERALADE